MSNETMRHAMADAAGVDVDSPDEKITNPLTKAFDDLGLNTPEPPPIANDSTPIYATHVVTVTARCEVTIAVNAKDGPAAIEKAREAFERGDYDADHPVDPEWYGADIEAPAHKTSNLLRGAL